MADAAPALFLHVVRVYDKMMEYAKDVNGDMIFEGNTTSIVKELGLGNNYYSPIFKILKGGGYVTQLRRGGGGTSSTYQLNERPVAENFERDKRNSGAGENPGDKSLAAVIKLTQRLEKLEQKYDTLARAMMTIQNAVIGKVERAEPDWGELNGDDGGSQDLS